MNIITRSGLILLAIAALGGSAFAQDASLDAKGNAAVKPMHTVNDGGPKAGANSFTRAQARQHVLNSGYDAVGPLTRGADGVWRGTATKAGASVAVASDRSDTLNLKLSLGAAGAAVSLAGAAHAGCLGWAAVGGVAGHFAGHHALLGAAAGCAVGHYTSHHRRRYYR